MSSVLEILSAVIFVQAAESERSSVVAEIEDLEQKISARGIVQDAAETAGADSNKETMLPIAAVAAAPAKPVRRRGM
jgi:hypothetical protein